MAADVTRRHRLNPDRDPNLPADVEATLPPEMAQKLPRRRSRALLAWVAVPAVAFIVGSAIWAGLGRDEAETDTQVAEGQRDATAAQALNAVNPILQLCQEATPVGVALQADPRNPCELARQVVNDPVPAVAPIVERGPGPTPEQIRSAVESYMLLNPPPAGRPPTPAEVAAAVTAFLTTNPPQPGRPPTAEEIAAAVETYFATNPPPPGEKGEPGRAPTAEEIRAAVDQALADNPPPSGPQGVSVQSVRAETRDGGCVLVFVLLDPADSTSSEVAVPVADGVCEDGVRGPRPIQGVS